MLPKEKSWLPGTPNRGEGTAETSFTEGGIPETPTQENILSEEERQKVLEKAEKDIKEIWPNTKSKVLRGKIGPTKGVPVILGKNNGEIPVYSKTGGTINPNIDQTKYIKEQLGAKRTELIQQKDQEIKELCKTIQEDMRVADDENEQPSVRERARERITENTERRTQLLREGEQLAEKLPLRERIKELFKKHGFTLATVVTAVGITIVVLAKILADGASAAANGIKIVTKKVGDGLKELGKKTGSILPGLVGAVASFVFRAAGQAITFLGKTAWLLILFVAAFMIEKITKKRRE